MGIVRSGLASAVIAAGLIGWATPLSAQPAPNLADLSIEDLLNVKVETVVGASKYKQRVTEAPASVTIVTAEEIQRQQYRSIADVLRSVRGFYVTYDRNYNYIGTRGFIRPGDYNSRLLVLVDGHRLNDNIFGGALIGQEFPVDISLIDRIEVVRGPGSALYGSSAMFGVINIITRQPAEASGTSLTLLGGGLSTAGVAVTHARVPQHGSAFLASLAAYRSSGGTDLFYPEYDDGTPGSGHALHRDRTRRLNGLVNARHGGFAFQALYGLREKHVPTGAFGALFNDPETRTLDGQGYADVTYTRAWRDGTELNTRTFLDDYRYTASLPYVIDGARVLNHDRAFGVWWGGEVRLSRTVVRHHRVTGGFEFRDNLRQFQENYDVSPRVEYLRDARNVDVWSLYAEDDWRVHERVHLNVGVRGDAYRGFTSAVKPRAALIVSPTPKTTIKALYGEAFRAPTVYELYWTQAEVTRSNPDLRHEEMTNAELVLEQYLGRQWRVSANAFRYRLRSLVDQSEDPDGLLVYRNQGAVNGEGAEFEAEGRWDSGWLIRISQTVQRSRNLVTATPLSNSPRALFQSSVSLPVGQTGLLVSMNLQAMSQRRTLTGDPAPAYAVANLSVTAPRLTRRLELGVSAWNLFGARYGDPGSEEHRQTLIAQDGRVLGVQARFRF